MVEKMSTDDAIQHACGNLADGFQIRIELEKGAGSVKLINDEGDETDMWQDETSIAQQILNAVTLSHNQSTQQGDTP